MKTLCISLSSLGIILLFLNSFIYLYPEEVATAPRDFKDKVFFYFSLHFLFFLGLVFITMAYIINRKRKKRLLNKEMESKINVIGSVQ